MIHNVPSTGEMPSEALATATQIFAGLGYDNTSIETLVAAGIDPSVVAAAGGKPGLYRAVMQATANDLRAALEVWEAQFTSDGAGVRQFLNDYLNYSIGHPQLSSLWMHRGMADAADLAELEREHLGEVVDRVAALFRETAQLDLQYAVMTIQWCVYGFMRGGILDGHKTRIDPADLAERKRFRGYMHDLMALMFRSAVE